MNFYRKVLANRGNIKISEHSCTNGFLLAAEAHYKKGYENLWEYTERDVLQTERDNRSDI